MIYLTPLAEKDGQLDPATSVDGALIPLTAPGMRAPVCDRELLRFVVIAPAGFPAPGDWLEKSEAEINEIYPGTF